MVQNHPHDFTKRPFYLSAKLRQLYGFCPLAIVFEISLPNLGRDICFTRFFECGPSALPGRGSPPLHRDPQYEASFGGLESRRLRAHLRCRLKGHWVPPLDICGTKLPGRRGATLNYASISRSQNDVKMVHFGPADWLRSIRRSSRGWPTRSADRGVRCGDRARKP
jgi:hypothetical protein